jgi:hypothetical protein
MMKDVPMATIGKKKKSTNTHTQKKTDAYKIIVVALIIDWLLKISLLEQTGRYGSTLFSLCYLEKKKSKKKLLLYILLLGFFLQ